MNEGRSNADKVKRGKVHGRRFPAGSRVGRNVLGRASQTREVLVSAYEDEVHRQVMRDADKETRAMEVRLGALQEAKMRRSRLLTSIGRASDMTKVGTEPEWQSKKGVRQPTREHDLKVTSHLDTAHGHRRAAAFARQPNRDQDGDRDCLGQTSAAVSHKHYQNVAALRQKLEGRVVSRSTDQVDLLSAPVRADSHEDVGQSSEFMLSFIASRPRSRSFTSTRANGDEQYDAVGGTMSNLVNNASRSVREGLEKLTIVAAEQNDGDERIRRSDTLSVSDVRPRALSVGAVDRCISTAEVRPSIERRHTSVDAVRVESFNSRESHTGETWHYNDHRANAKTNPNPQSGWADDSELLRLKSTRPFDDSKTRASLRHRQQSPVDPQIEKALNFRKQLAPKAKPIYPQIRVNEIELPMTPPLTARGSVASPPAWKSPNTVMQEYPMSDSFEPVGFGNRSVDQDMAGHQKEHLRLPPLRIDSSSNMLVSKNNSRSLTVLSTLEEFTDYSNMTLSSRQERSHSIF